MPDWEWLHRELQTLEAVQEENHGTPEERMQAITKRAYEAQNIATRRETERT